MRSGSPRLARFDSGAAPLSRAVSLACAFLALAGCGGDGEGLPAGPSSERLAVRAAGSVEGASLGYLEYLPPGYGDGTPRPLLVFLHGVGENGDGSRASLARLGRIGIPQLIENDQWPSARPFVVLMPQHEDLPGGSCSDGAEIDAFLDFALEHYDVDKSRVYLTGLSCGAIGAWDYLAAHTDQVVAGAVLIAGEAIYPLAVAGCALGRVPIWAFHGAADDVVPTHRITVPVRELKACKRPRPLDLRLTVYPGVGHDSWTRTYDLSAGHDVYAWLLQHEK